jgi:hypothetical protein
MNGIQESLDTALESFSFALLRSFECLKEENQSIISRKAKIIEIKKFLDEEAKVRSQFINPDKLSARCPGKGDWIISNFHIPLSFFNLIMILKGLLS